jgi:hypothetical protein
MVVKPDWCTLLGVGIAIGGIARRIDRDIAFTVIGMALNVVASGL